MPPKALKTLQTRRGSGIPTRVASAWLTAPGIPLRVRRVISENRKIRSHRIWIIDDKAELRETNSRPATRLSRLIPYHHSAPGAQEETDRPQSGLEPPSSRSMPRASL